MSPNNSGAIQHDANLEIAVRDALDQNALPRIWKHSIQVRASAGTVVLSGAVRNHTIKEIAENLARAVKGTSAVQNEIVVDSDLELAIAQALASDPRTRTGFPGILVGVVFGVVYLKGTAATEELKKAAGEIAGRIAGVLRVSNELMVPAKATPPARS